MKKIIIILLLVSGNLFAQETSKEYLNQKIQSQLEYNMMTDAFLNLIALKENFEEDDQSRFLTVLVTYVTSIKDIEYRDFKTMQSISKYLNNEVLYFKDKDKAVQVLFMSTMVDFSFIYYRDFRKELSENQIKNLKTKLNSQANTLNGKLSNYQDKIDKVIEYVNR